MHNPNSCIFIRNRIPLEIKLTPVLKRQANPRSRGKPRWTDLMTKRDVNLKPKKEQKENRDWSGVMSFKSLTQSPTGYHGGKNPPHAWCMCVVRDNTKREIKKKIHCKCKIAQNAEKMRCIVLEMIKGSRPMGKVQKKGGNEIVSGLRELLRR
ncbi:hypothetical protein M440DRAFT_173509 [Trichoderma longibrachiatum ATCC 18648]|uniref:Uncharacterized protein n=1 Tax=Trichoderma longibrachiatum ATCC 18648 TaxID=983965 RepID=A0A2T4CEA4_TRILO|nr:hypothetical protein M440DRAFT_173509 [Trichoderma longibrachiatum ATCC 18648]